MPRDGATTFSDLIGKLDLLRVRCDKCGRDGCYGLSRLIEKRGRDGKIVVWLDALTGCYRVEGSIVADIKASPSPAMPSMYTAPLIAIVVGIIWIVPIVIKTTEKSEVLPAAVMVVATIMMIAVMVPIAAVLLSSAVASRVPVRRLTGWSELAPTKSSTS
jgi:hypothetical protein